MAGGKGEVEKSREESISDKKTSREAAEEAAAARRVQIWTQPSVRLWEGSASSNGEFSSPALEISLG